jgi:hypothetical protein
MKLTLQFEPSLGMRILCCAGAAIGEALPNNQKIAETASSRMPVLPALFLVTASCGEWRQFSRQRQNLASVEMGSGM